MAYSKEIWVLKKWATFYGWSWDPKSRFGKLRVEIRVTPCPTLLRRNQQEIVNNRVNNRWFPWTVQYCVTLASLNWVPPGFQIWNRFTLLMTTFSDINGNAEYSWIVRPSQKRTHPCPRSGTQWVRFCHDSSQKTWDREKRIFSSQEQAGKYKN